MAALSEAAKKILLWVGVLIYTSTEGEDCEAQANDKTRTKQFFRAGEAELPVSDICAVLTVFFLVGPVLAVVYWGQAPQYRTLAHLHAACGAFFLIVLLTITCCNYTCKPGETQEIMVTKLGDNAMHSDSERRCTFRGCLDLICCTMALGYFATSCILVTRPGLKGPLFISGVCGVISAAVPILGYSANRFIGCCSPSKEYTPVKPA